MLDSLVTAFTTFIESFHCLAVVQPYQRAVRITFGKRVAVLEPGMHWRLPFGFSRIIKENVAWTTTDLPAQAIETKDGVPVVVSGVVTWRINDVRRYVIEVEDADSVLADASRGVIRHALCDLRHEDMKQETKELDARLTKPVRKRAWRWGVEVEQVSLSDLTKAETYRLLVDGTLISAGSGDE